MVAASDAETASAEPGAQDAPRGKRERSTIEFPYSDLSSCLELARMLHSRAGSRCTDVQLAAWMNQSASGGGFRSRISAAKLFGLIETEGQAISITPLGRQAIDDERGGDARAEAFLRVPLFAAMYTEFNGVVLPPAAAIERHMEALGVASKQKDRARQTFTKSANYASFIDDRTGRFIKPAFADSNTDHQGAKPPHKDDKKPPGGGGSGEQPPLHPFIRGLLETLPAPRAEWPASARADWLQTAASIFKLIYAGDGAVEVKVVAPKDSAAAE